MILDLRGKWNYRIDKEDIGIKNNWYKYEYSDGKINLPGSTAEAKIGEPLNMQPVMSKDSVKRLRERHSYIGVMWYTQTVFIPKEMENKEFYLYLERVMWESMIWIDDNFIGCFDSLSVPHKFRITEFVQAGAEHKITIRVDNREKYNIKEFSSAYTQETQSIWNGIIGEIYIDIKDKVNIGKINIKPNVKEKEVELEIIINNYSSHKNYYIDLEVNGFQKDIIKISLGNEKKCIKFKYKMGGDIELWSEFNPYLYELKCKIRNEKIIEEKVVEFGMREVATDGKHILLNGERIFLRGTLDCCIYPLTGYPPTSIEEWIKIFNIIKEYGLNHIRFHSWCPPDNAFKAADKCGIYIQAEGPIWLDDYFCEIGSYKDHYEFFPKEAKRIISEYANHPSFILFSNGNEIRGDFKLLNNIVRNLKRDKRVLYTLTTNWDREVFDGDDVFIAQSFDDIGVRGQYFLNEMIEGINLVFDDAVKTRNLPTISHEVGQYSIYPDIRDINKYKGVLRPINLEAIKNDLEKKGLINDIDKFVKASGKLAVNLYKDDIESALRTKDLSGVQLLDLHDFPGQSTATVGILNSFWESKNLIEAKDFRGFFGSVVPLIVTNKRIYSNKEILEFSILVWNYSNEEIKNVNIRYKITCKDEVIYSEVFFVRIINKNALGDIKKAIKVNLAKIHENSKLNIEVSIDKTEYKNSWNIWVYKDENCNNTKIVETEKEILESIERKENIIINLTQRNMKNIRKNKYFPCFWSPVHFETSDPNGLYVDSENILFKDFPTEDFGDYQWKSIVESSIIINIEEVMPYFNNIVQVVPNFYSNEAMSIICATRIEDSNVILTSIDFENINDKAIEVRALFNSIVNNINKIEIKESIKKNNFIKYLQKIQNMLL